MSTDFDFIFYLDYLAKTFVGEDGGTPLPLTLVLDDQYLCGLKFLQTANGAVVEIQKKVRSIKANVGASMDPPAAGKFSLKFTNGVKEGTSDPIDFNATAEQFLAACAPALTALHADLTMTEVVQEPESCWTFRLSGVGIVEPVEIERVDNTLRPASFVRRRPYLESSTWLYEIRLIQSSLVFSGAFERVLPSPPSIKTIADGAPRVPGSSANTNEVQALRVPAEFIGTYHLVWNYHATRILGKDDGIVEIADALNKMFSDGQTRFLVTNPVVEQAYIEFVGPLQEANQPEMEVVVDSFPPGIVRFMLDCEKEEFATALRKVKEIREVPFEIELNVVGDEQDPNDSTIPSRRITFQTTCTVKRDAIFDELQTRVSHDWQQPPQPVVYTKISPDQIIVGQQNFDVAFGAPGQLAYQFTHDLNTAAGYVSIRTNDPDGYVLGQGTEYDLQMDPDFIRVILLENPATADGLVLTFLAAGPRAVFLAHHHNIDEVDGLRAFIDQTTETIGEILDTLPFTNPTSSTPADQQIDILIPDKFRSFPGKYVKQPTTLADVAAPTKTGFLPPAIHDATVEDHDFTTSMIDLATGKGKVYRHTGAVDIQLQGGGTHKGPVVGFHDLVGCDGRFWYKVRQQLGTNSFYATDMEWELFKMPISSSMLRPGQYIEAHLDFTMQALATDVVSQFLFIVEFGSPRSEPAPSPTGINLKDILWNTVPIVQEVILVSSMSVTGKFGFNVLRAQDNTINANGFTYGSVNAALTGAKPTSANFVARGKLAQYDVVDDVLDPRGGIFSALTAGKAVIR